MTRDASNIGDKGQRYEVRAFNFPRPGKHAIGWSDNRGVADRMAESIRLAPGCTGAVVVDRREGQETKPT